jgi:hypothetical protein
VLGATAADKGTNTMSNEDPHKTIRNVALTDGWSQHADIAHDEFCAYQQAKLIVHPPESRIAVLNQLDQVIGQDDGGSLRAKSQLVDLRKRLSLTHEQLLKARR